MSASNLSLNNATTQHSYDVSLLAALVSAGIWFFVFWLIFPCCKKWKAPYYHRAEHYPDDSANWLFAWIPATIKYSMTDLNINYGLDAVMNIEIIKTFIMLILFMSIFSILILIPVDATCDGDQIGTAIISMANCYSDNNPRLYAHAISVINNTLLCWIFAYALCQKYVAYRQEYRYLPKPHNYTIRIKGYKKDIWSEADLLKTMEQILGPGSVLNIHTVPVGPGIKKLEKLRNKRFAAVKAIEGIDAKVAAGKGTDDLQQDKRIWQGKIHKYDLEIAELLNQTAPWTMETKEKVKNCNPCMKIGFISKKVKLSGAKKRGEGTDATSYPMVDEVLNTRKIVINTENVTNVTYVTFHNMMDARMAARFLLGRKTSGWKCSPAVEPEDVNWVNHKPRNTLAGIGMKILGYIVYAHLLVMWFIPVGLAVAFAQLTVMGEFVPFLRPVSNALDSVQPIKAFIQGFVPQLIILGFYALLPAILAKIADIFFKPLSYSGRSQMVMKGFFFFSAINILLAGIVASAAPEIYKQAGQIVSSPITVIVLIGASVPSKANFFLNYVLAASVVKASKALLMPVGLIMLIIKEKFFAKTPRAKDALYKPKHQNYTKSVAMHAFIFLLALTFSSLQPLMMPIALLYMVCFYIVDKYIILYHSKQLWEGGGRYFPSVFLLICLAIEFYNIVMIIVFIGAKLWFGVVVCGFALGFTPLFYWFISFHQLRDTAYYGSLIPLLEHPAPNITDLDDDAYFAYTHVLIKGLDDEELPYDKGTMTGGPVKPKDGKGAGKFNYPVQTGAKDIGGNDIVEKTTPRARD